MSIQNLYSLTIAVSGFICPTSVSTKSTAKIVVNTINQKKGPCLTRNQGCGNWMQTQEKATGKVLTIIVQTVFISKR